jgi:hypothetical protein
MAKPTKRTRQLLKDRTRLEWLMLVLLLIIGYLLLASHFVWWPSHKTYADLGSAFYAGIPANADANNNSSSTKSGSSTSNGSSTGSNGTTGSTGSSGAGTGTSAGGSGGSTSGGGSGSGSGSGGSGSTSSGSDLIDFAGGVNTGASKQQVDAKARNLKENCAVVVKTSTAGKQEVCTYTKGNKVITVTYLNNHVISASRSGF